MKYYIEKDKIGTSDKLPVGALEIDKDRYKELLAKKLAGFEVIEENKEIKIYSLETQKIYSKENGQIAEISIDKDIPQEYTTEPRPDEFHTFVGEKWELTDIKGLNEQIKSQRASTYRKEADPLFFKSQRGEATIEEWQGKVNEIKERFPYA